MTADSDETTVTDDQIRGMVERIEPDWEVETIERIPYGTDFIATLTGKTREGTEQVVLKAVTADHMPPAAGRGEARFLDIAARTTAVPVPTVYGHCDDHDTYPSPFYLMDYVEGENYEGRPDELLPDARERIVQEAGRNIARLHELGPVSGVGRMGYADGELQVIDPENRSASTDAVHNHLLDSAEETLDSFDSGGFFPEFAERENRFGDLVEPIREYLRETLPTLPEPGTLTYCHSDYRYGNLLVDPETGETRAVVDWGQMTAHDPVYNIAHTECMLTSPEGDGKQRSQELRGLFRAGYTDVREDWVFDEQRTERMREYRLLYRLNAMACLPLWLKDEPLERRDEREQEHRDFVAQYL
jgi:aminoglycoside phosphotransferase (APT) family kinase protein